MTPPGAVTCSVQTSKFMFTFLTACVSVCTRGSPSNRFLHLTGFFIS